MYFLLIRTIFRITIIDYLRKEIPMININECMKRYGRSPLFTKMIENELKSHGTEICVCSYEFTQFFVTRGLGSEPITTTELIQLKNAL